MSDGFKAFLVVILIITLLVFGGLAIKVLLFPIHVLDKSVNTAYDVTTKTMNAESAIYNYEWFKMQEESIGALYKKEDSAKKSVEEYISMLDTDKSKWTNDDKNEITRLRSISTAYENQINDAMAEYNAKSNMVNRAIFKDNLPSNIDRAYLAGKNLTK